jgi:hypothetical protein
MIDFGLAMLAASLWCALLYSFLFGSSPLDSLSDIIEESFKEENNGSNCR